MNHTFDLKFNRMRDNDPGNKEEPGCIDRYEHPGHDRKVCFVLADGSRKRLNYGLLVDEDYYPETNTIVLNFTSCTVTLVGIHLEELFADLQQNMPRVIRCVDSRYNELQENNAPVVNQITITKTKS